MKTKSVVTQFARSHVYSRICRCADERHDHHGTCSELLSRTTAADAAAFVIGTLNFFHVQQPPFWMFRLRRILSHLIGRILLIYACMFMADIQASATTIFDTVPLSLKQFAMTSEDNILGQAHLWVNGGGLTANPDFNGVASVFDVVAPPWTTANQHLEITFNGMQITPEGYLWLPGEFHRHGWLPGKRKRRSDIYSGRETGVEIRTLLSPVVDRRSFVEWVELSNTSMKTQRVVVAITSQGYFGMVSNSSWGWESVTHPKQGTGNVFTQFSNICLKSFRTNVVQCVSQHNALVLTCNLAGATFNTGALTGTLVLPPGHTKSFAIALALGRESDADILAEEVVRQPDITIESNRSQWMKWITALYEHLPHIISSNRKLVDFYNRSLLSYLIARWNLPEMAMHPWFATSGLDGGGLCCYPWDWSYMPQVDALAYPDSDRDLIRLFLRANLAKGYALLPFNAQMVGTRYAYDDYAIIRLIYYYVLMTGDKAFLNERLGGKTVWEWSYEHAIYHDDLDQPVKLIDYGDNEHLLELHNTQNYTHYVPSPNAERCWSYRAIDTMAVWAGKEAPRLSSRADQLANLIRGTLWSPTARWFVSLDKTGKPRLGYSMQVFDMLRFDILQPEEIEGMVSHLNEKEFLSKWGVHSYSKAAPGYDPTDIDWGGPGVYAGDAPELVNDLLHAGCFKQADNVFSRILWWGETMPYYPQAIRADRRDYRRDGRANVAGGAAGAEMMIFGLLGMHVNIDGTVQIDPHLPAFAKDLKFEGVKIRGHRFDVWLQKDGYYVWVLGHEPIYARYGQSTSIPNSAQSRHGS